MPAPFTTPVAQSVPFEADRNPQVNGEAGPSQISSLNVQDAIEEANLTDIPVVIGLDNALGTSRKKARADHVHRINNLTHTHYSPRQVAVSLTDGGELTLNNESAFCNVFTGNSTMFSIRLPDATTLKAPALGSTKFEFYNQSSIPIKLLFFGGTQLYQIAVNSYVQVTLKTNETADGTWLILVSDLIDITNPDFAGVKDGFEDFMFDAYAGNGGNDNQYAFTKVDNNGLSDIDGATTVVGNDYEGIHTLSSLISATSRPLVYSFNGVNRLKLGAQPESFEIRVRIPILQDSAQKFTCRYGLMDGILAGAPANGVIFTSEPTYAVTAVAQVVTVTPVTTSKAPTQTFTEVINGFNYTYTYTTTKTIQLTTWTRANNTLYRVTINGINCDYTSDANATDAEIAVGLANAINTNVGATVTAVTTGGTKPVIITGDVVGANFTWSTSANITSVDNTATPVASTIVSSLISSINADGPLPVTASGTTTLILTADVAGIPFTYADANANLTNVLTTANVAAVAYSNRWFADVINSSSQTRLDTGIDIVANRWYRLKCVTAADGSAAFIYIDSVFIGKISVPLPTSALKFVFKLEKTLGTSNRTTDIDYITWRRTRG